MKYSMLLLILLVVVFSACSSKTEGCPLPPDDYTEADLIGSWQGRHGADTDTLIIREDGLYKQIIDAPTRDYYYESDWLPWRIEYTLNGIQYLHFEDLRMCVYYYRDDCDKPDAGEHTWGDFCNDRTLATPGYGVFMVLGVHKRFIQPPKGIRLYALKVETYHIVSYKLLEP